MSRDMARYARSGAWSIAAYAIQVVGALVLSVIVVRWLGQTDFGVLSEVRQLVQLATILGGLAVERSLLRFLPKLLASRNERGARTLFWQTLGLRILLWIPVMLLARVFGDQLEALFHVELANLVLIGVATSLVFSIYNHVRAAATARFQTRIVGISTALGSLVTLGSTIWALDHGYGVAGVLVSAALGMGVAALIQLPAALGRGQGLDGSEGDGFSVTDPSFVRYALPFAGIAVLNYAVHSATEVFFLGHYHGPEMAGHYLLGFTFAQRLIDFLPLALWEVSMAGFAEIASKDASRLPEALNSYVKLLYLLLFPIAALGVAFSPWLVRLLYGPEMMPAALISQAYFAIATVAAMGAPIGMIVYARDRTASALKAYLVFAIVNIGLDAVLIPRLALPGALIGLGTAKFVAVALMCRIAWGEVPELKMPWTFLGRAALASSPVLLWLIVPMEWISFLALALGALAAILALIVSFRLLRVVGESEAKLIRSTALPLRHVFLQLLGAPEEIA